MTTQSRAKAARSIRNVVSGAAVLGTLAFAGAAQAQAQNFEPVRFDLGLGLPYGPGYGAYGVGGILEGKFLFHDNIAAGLRFEANAQLGGKAGGSAASVSLAGIGAALVEGEYLFGSGSVRPFLGMGAGLYWLSGGEVSAGTSSASASSSAGRFFGIAPQVGIDLGRTRLGLAYNALFGTDNAVTQSVSIGGAATESVSRNYFLLDLSFRIGGNPRPAARTIESPMQHADAEKAPAQESQSAPDAAPRIAHTPAE